MYKTLEIDNDIILKQLELDDCEDIYKTINNQREYLGKWLPFVESTKEPNDTKKFVEMTVGLPEDRFEYIFTIRYKNQFGGLIGFKCTDKGNNGNWLLAFREFAGKRNCNKIRQTAL